MALFLLAGVLTLAAMALVALPLLSAAPSEDRADREGALYRDQLAEIDRDLSREVLTEAQANAARTEVERRLLAAGRRPREAGLQVSRTGRLAAMALIGLIPLGAGAIYLALGAPDQPAQPFASRQPVAAPALPAGTHEGMASRIAALETRLAEDPSDLAGQALLARSYAAVGDFERALATYARANQLAEGRDRRLAGEYAEAMVMAADGMVTDDALSIFIRIAEDHPDDPQSRYYLALHAAQNGATADAVAALRSLEADTPADAPWRPAVEGLLSELGAAPAAPVPPPVAIPGPTADQMAAAAALTPAQQEQMIAGMVGRLASRLEANPDDLEGWRRLARAYEVLERPEEAARAYREILRLAPNDPAASAALGRSAPADR